MAIVAKEQTAASVPTPAADYNSIFSDSADGLWKTKNDAGSVAGLGSDTDAIHDNVAGEIVLVTEKVTPIVADLLVIEDSAAGNAKKRVQIGNIPAFVGDSGAGGVKGYVPAPAAGDAAAGKYLDSDGTWTVPPAGGSLALTDLTDVTLTAPATGSVLVKSAGDWVDGQVDLADADAVTGVLAKANLAATTVHTDQTNTYSTGAQDFQAATDVDVKDSAFEIHDNLDPTKTARFQCSSITTATTRTYEFPNEDTIIVGHDTTQTLTGKSISAAANTLTIGLNDLSDVALTAPATGAVLVKSAGDWVDGQVDLADADAITGTLAAGNGGTGITSLGAGVATFLGTPTSANLIAAVTDETGSGALVFANTPTLVTPILGVASATSLATSAATPLKLTNAQLVDVALTAQTVGATTLTIPDFASVVDEFTFKTKAQTMSNKTLVAPALGTPASGTLTNCNGTAASLTAGTCTTIPNLTGCVTSTGNTTSTTITSPVFATSAALPQGAGGTTVDAAGEVCVDTTSRTLNFHDGTAEVTLNPQKEYAFLLEAPVAADDLPIIRFDQAFTLTKTVYAITGGTNWIGQLSEASDAQGTGAADTQAADSTVTGTTTVTSYSNAAIAAGNYVRVKTTSVSGSVTWLHVTFYGRMDP